MKNINKRSGQTLLIIILLATVLLTVGLSVSHVTQQEQKITKLEQDAKQAYAAAEAGLDAALKQAGTVSIGSLGPVSYTHLDVYKRQIRGKLDKCH